MPNPIELFPWIAERFDRPKSEGNGQFATVPCPLGPHRSARLRFWCGSDGRLVFGCHACGDSAKLEILRRIFPEDVASKKGVWRHCFPEGKAPDKPRQDVTARYRYLDAAGVFVYETVRLEPGRNGRDKDFRQRRPDPGRKGKWVWNLEGVERVLYHLPDLLGAAFERCVFVTAGEKDADTLAGLGLMATTNVCGEHAAWLESYSEALAGRHVAVVEDPDPTGRRHADEVAGSLLRHAASLRRLLFPGRDATAFVSALRAGGVHDTRALADAVWAETEATPLWKPTRTRNKSAAVPSHNGAGAGGQTGRTR